MSFQIPQELVAATSERRVIPFIGAGFSTALNFPAWDSLLERLAQEVGDSLKYDEIRKLCDGDRLRMAEYYFLKCDKRIGPIRHLIELAFASQVNPILSSSHVELVNLGAPQIYTTNYDDLLEKTFQGLGQPVDVIVLPKDIATSKGIHPQIVKYHGDLKHEGTLVLTESSYYARLDFESPMDLKFRSDLLGKSVLFMGYSLSDLNIRIIWYRLMRLMRDIPAADRPASYIVRFEPNPVLQLLYEDVGIKTIVLDPEGTANDNTQKTTLLSEFLHNLATNSADQGRIPGYGAPIFASRFTVERAKAELNGESEAIFRMVEWFWKRNPISSHPDARLPDASGGSYLERLSERRIPDILRSEVELLMSDTALQVAKSGFPSRIVRLAVSYVEQWGACSAATEVFALAMTVEVGATVIMRSQLPWTTVWGGKIRREIAEGILAKFEAELQTHQKTLEISTGTPKAPHPRDQKVTHNMAYCTDVVYRIGLGTIISEDNADLASKGKELLARAARLYPAIHAYHVDEKLAPLGVATLIEEIDARKEKPDSSNNDEDT